MVLSSGYDEADLSVQFDGYGMAGFIQKPYRLAKLRSVLQRVLVEEEG